MDNNMFFVENYAPIVVYSVSKKEFASAIAFINMRATLQIIFEAIVQVQNRWS